MDVIEAFTSYTEDVVAFRNQSKRTEEHHNLALRSFVKHVGNIQVDSITFQIVRNWKLALEAENKSDTTVRGYIIKLRNVMKYLNKKGIGMSYDEIPIPKRVDTVPTWISPEEVTKLIDACPHIRAKAIVSLLYSSGVRVTELTQLNRDQLQDRRFTVMGKGNKPRLCFYDERTELYLNKYLSKRTDEHPALFIQRLSKQRMNKGGVEEIFRIARRKIGNKKITPHTLRHSYATQLISNGMPIHTLQRLMGHSNISTTSVYLHVSYPQLQSEYEKYHQV